MLRKGSAVCLGALICIMVYPRTALATTSDWLLWQPGTINQALSQPDGSPVSVDAVVVTRIHQGDRAWYLVVREPWARDIVLLTASSPIPELRREQTVDLQGVMATLSSGRRVLLCKRIALYLDRFGYPATAPPVKGILETFTWPWKIWVDADSGLTPYEAGMSALSIDSGWTIAEEPSPPGEPSQPMSIPEPAVETIAWAKTFDDGNSLTSTLPAKKVTVGTGQFTDCIYIEEPGRSCGIRVEPNAGAFLPGDVVDVTAGTLQTTADEERFIDAATVAWVGSGIQLRPVGIRNRELGGGRFWDGTDIWQEGVVGGFGQNNIGLLAKTWGKITQQGPGYVYINDGSGTSECEGCTQVRVETDHLATGNSIALPAPDRLLWVTGISSCKNVDSQIVRVIRPRSQADILGPWITITSPENNCTITKPTGDTHIPISGTVHPGDDSITSVQIRLDGQENWLTADLTVPFWTYQSLSIGPGPHIIQAKATDNSGWVVYAQVAINVVTKGIVYVKWDSPGPTFDGASWNTAYHTVQAGIDDANLGDEVWVAAGTYVERITLESGVGLYAGFIGTEFYREQRNWTANLTILDGKYGGSVVTSPEGATPSSTVIDGFTIRNGTASEGGAIYCNSSSPTISNNIMAWNIATYRGGAIFCASSDAVITSNTISNNQVSGTQAAYGGALCLVGGSPTVANNIIMGNKAYAPGGGAWGGAIHCEGNSSFTVSSNMIVHNEAAVGGMGSASGAAIHSAESSITLVNNTIADNVITGEAGGDGSVYLASSSTEMVNNIVAFNSHGVYSDGGGTSTLRKNDVFGNGVYQYSGVSSGDDIIPAVDPQFVDKDDPDNPDYHLLAASLCVGAGDDSAAPPGSLDVDGQARIRGPHIDVGADEVHGPSAYDMTLAGDPLALRAGGTSTITVTVTDHATGQGVRGILVDLRVNGGELVSPAPGYGTTDADGRLYAEVTRSNCGPVTVTAQINNFSGAPEISRTIDLAFYDASVSVMFLIDFTGSTSDKELTMRNGITGTVNYLAQQLQTQGVTLRVGGIKFSNQYTPSPLVCDQKARLYDFTTDTAAFNVWVNEGSPEGGDERQLDILMCVKDKDPAACPGLYVALATDEDSDSTLDKWFVAAGLNQSNAIVFIDHAVRYDPEDGIELMPYYLPLAVNGGALEEETGNLGTFTFQHMRQAILGS
jgi:hypothetical protein